MTRSNLAELLCTLNTAFTAGMHPQVVYVPRDLWVEIESEISMILEQSTGNPMPIVNEEYLTAGIEHFLLKMIPIVPV